MSNGKPADEEAAERAWRAANPDWDYGEPPRAAVTVEVEEWHAVDVCRIVSVESAAEDETVEVAGKVEPASFSSETDLFLAALENERAERLLFAQVLDTGLLAAARKARSAASTWDHDPGELDRHTIQALLGAEPSFRTGKQAQRQAAFAAAVALILADPAAPDDWLTPEGMARWWEIGEGGLPLHALPPTLAVRLARLLERYRLFAAGLERHAWKGKRHSKGRRSEPNVKRLRGSAKAQGARADAWKEKLYEFADSKPHLKGGQLHKAAHTHLEKLIRKGEITFKPRGEALNSKPPRPGTIEKALRKRDRQGAKRPGSR